jgi:hypothetical protein
MEATLKGWEAICSWKPPWRVYAEMLQVAVAAFNGQCLTAPRHCVDLATDLLDRIRLGGTAEEKTATELLDRMRIGGEAEEKAIFKDAELRIKQSCLRGAAMELKRAMGEIPWNVPHEILSLVECFKDGDDSMGLCLQVVKRRRIIGKAPPAFPAAQLAAQADIARFAQGRDSSGGVEVTQCFHSLALQARSPHATLWWLQAGASAAEHIGEVKAWAAVRFEVEGEEWHV